ncbi:zinc finger protein [Babesia caballi]|uniref:Zinc finger protein n=1 Tax=Babesia caballi TaxID=5871 RepID=A0AAV4LWM8_BABCB|nr:zinc finger protein [Babesia caballi]
MESPIVRDSDEWNTLEFALQLRCRSSRVNLLQAWNITKPDAVSVFSRWVQGSPITEVFIDAESLDRSNSVQDVCTRGFDIGANGFKVSVGNIQCKGFPLVRSTVRDNAAAEAQSGVPWSSSTSKGAGALDDGGKVLPPKNLTTANMMYGDKRVYEYFVCDVALGKSIKASDEVEAQRLRLSMPVEYDSVYLESAAQQCFPDVTLFSRQQEAEGALDHLSDETFTEGVLPRFAFNREYIVYGSSQILPRYLIQFECDAAAEETFALPLCDSCLNDAATLYCPSDSARICAKCDEKLHSHNKVVSRHIRMPLNQVMQMPRPVARCRLHRTKVYTMYCTVCHVPICQLCASAHIHGQGSEDGNAVRFISIANAYDAALHEMQQESSALVVKRRKHLHAVLEELRNIEQRVEENCDSVETSCYENLEVTLSELHAKINGSLEALIVEQTENKRQLSELDWSEHFVEYVKNTLLPADCLRAWLRHCRLRNQIDQDSSREPLQEVFPDIDLQGDLGIMHEPSANHVADDVDGAQEAADDEESGGDHDLPRRALLEGPDDEEESDSNELEHAPRGLASLPDEAVGDDVLDEGQRANGDEAAPYLPRLGDGDVPGERLDEHLELAVDDPDEGQDHGADQVLVVMQRVAAAAHNVERALHEAGAEDGGQEGVDEGDGHDVARGDVLVGGADDEGEQQKADGLPAHGHVLLTAGDETRGVVGRDGAGGEDGEGRGGWGLAEHDVGGAEHRHVGDGGEGEGLEQVGLDPHYGEVAQLGVELAEVAQESVSRMNSASTVMRLGLVK